MNKKNDNFPGIPYKKKRKGEEKNKTLITIISINVVTSLVIGFFGGVFGFYFVNGYFKSNATNVSSENFSQSAYGGYTTEQVVDLVADSVVEVMTETNYMDYISEGAGSGVIISEDGYIVTNQHVIEGSDKIIITLTNDKEYEAKIIGEDKKEDIALLKIDAEGLKPIEFGDSSNLKVGEKSIVIGNPLGQLGGSVTDGIISAVDRTLNIDGVDMTLLQTNAEINPGNSGGGIFNSKGQLIAIVVAKSTGEGREGLGFGIPSNKVLTVISSLKK